MEDNSAIGLTFILGILGMGGTFMLFVMKQIVDIKKSLTSLCERMAREETKSQIYHNDNE